MGINNETLVYEKIFKKSFPMLNANGINSMLGFLSQWLILNKTVNIAFQY